MDPDDRARNRGRDGCHRLFVLELQQGLVQLNLFAFGDQDVDYGAGIRPFGQLGKLYVHEI